ALEVTVDVTGEARALPSNVEQTLWRVAQQALANAVEHVAASRVALTLGYLGDTVTLDVVDDGVGLAPGVRERQREDVAPGSGRGNGLPGMTDRVRAVGGTLSLESTPGSGTAVAVAVPL
ncbi:MAG: sensor histidine kinase, partial [Actinomycetaceae bacterium]